MNIENENSLFNHKSIYDITKFTHLDYPDKLACIIWFSGCNMRCDYCYNKEIVLAKSGNYSMRESLEFLKSRVGLLDGVVLSGGEATNHELVEFCNEIKKLGFDIKLDTNGTNFKNLQKLCDLKLIDYVALDYKAPVYKYKEITKSAKFNEFSATLEYLISGNIDFEVRTTIHADLLNEEDINFIIKELKSKAYTKPYYLQNFLYTENNLGNLQTPTNRFDKSLLLDELELVFR